MLCPVCRHDNFEGEDTCGNCGADLRTADIPQPALEYHDTVLGDNLEALGFGQPHTVDATLPVADAIREMHEAGLDCLLVCDDDRLVGIFTDRDAVVKVAGKPLDGLEVGSVMTRDPVVLRRGDTLAVAVHKMAVGGFRHIPVVEDDGTPLGVVAAPDVFRHIAAALG
jgi:signal-transduction protein with cAMP-binding, CBS, and nucleotidyltransferase domain